MEIIRPYPDGISSVAVTVMRRGDAFGETKKELRDGNTLPRLCKAVGEGACTQTCQLEGDAREYAGVLCAENNIVNALEQFGIKPENFVIASAMADNVRFGDDLEGAEAKPTKEGYTIAPKTNAFFFRPGLDRTTAGEPMDAVGMHLADCGSVNYEFKDGNGDIVLGQAHFSSTNMFGPSAFGHKLGDETVSWSEHVLGKAIEHYDADPKSVRINLVAAIGDDDFINKFDNEQALEERWRGWNDLGFTHQGVGLPAANKYLIDYRKMIEWQLRRAAERFGVVRSMRLKYAINTGRVALGHVSDYRNRQGVVAEGRDMYIVGFEPGMQRTITEAVHKMASGYDELGNETHAASLRNSVLFRRRILDARVISSPVLVPAL